MNEIIHSSNSGAILPFMVMSLILVVLVYRYATELLFYKRKNWDFDLKSGREVWLDWGAKDRQLTNRERIVFFYPFTIFVTFCVTLGAGAVIFFA